MAGSSLPPFVALAVRVYRALLLAYPRDFRRAYGPSMVQLFRDCCREAYRQAGPEGLLDLWRRTLLDLALTGPRERLARRGGGLAAVPLEPVERNDAMSRATFVARVLPYLLVILFGIALGYINLHTDETPFVAMPTLGAAFVLGCLSPRGAWRWGFLTGLWLPLSEAYAALVGMKLPYPTGDWTGALIGGVLFGLAGAYLGVLGRWMLAQMLQAPTDATD